MKYGTYKCDLCKEIKRPRSLVYIYGYGLFFEGNIYCLCASCYLSNVECPEFSMDLFYMLENE